MFAFHAGVEIAGSEELCKSTQRNMLPHLNVLVVENEKFFFVKTDCNGGKKIATVGVIHLLIVKVASIVNITQEQVVFGKKE